MKIENFTPFRCPKRAPKRAPKSFLVVIAVFCLMPGFQVSAGETRLPHMAGQFYPYDPVELKEAVLGFLEEGVGVKVKGKPRILIVPHAGYKYSGSTAGKAFNQVRGYSYDGVVIVGFTHNMSFEGSSVDQAGFYQTPLGIIKVHRVAADTLKTYPGIGYVEEAHKSQEHSVEVELPFIQLALDSPRIIPILMGNTDFESSDQLATALAELSQSGDYLFVFSTDLSHYHDSNTAENLDKYTINAMLFETAKATHRLFKQGIIEACGRGPIVTALRLAEKLGYLERTRISYTHSGFVGGEMARVVGYASIVMVDRDKGSGNSKWISKDAGDALVKEARLALQNSLGEESKESNEHGAEYASSVLINNFPELKKAQGLFVTLRKDGKLRGCIGRIDSKEPIGEILPNITLDSALRDHRFSPVTEEELDKLYIEVSVLSPPAKINRINELVAGRDGVILEYKGRRGVFLPSVWEETGWTRREFLRQLASQKAGLPPESWKDAALYVFQDQIFKEDSPAFSTAY